MLSSILELVYKLALLVALSAISGFMTLRREQKLGGAIFQGLLFGMAALIGMMRPLVLGQGPIFDGRSIMISLCGLFFGPLAGGIAAAMAAVYRMYLGGVGAYTGVAVIGASLVLGLVFHVRWTRRHTPLSAGRLWALGLLVHGVMLLMMFTLPAGVGWDVVRRLGLPILLIYPLFTLLAGKILDAEGSLRASREKFATIYNLSPDAIDLTHLETGVQVEANQSYLELFGYARGELIGHATLPGDLGTWISRESRDRHIARVKAHGKDLAFEVQLCRKDGTRFMALLSSALLEIGGERYNLSIIRDISERLRAESEIRGLNQNLEHRVKERTLQLEAANREMEAFSYSVSHDLRAPLRSIEGLSQALLEDCGDRLDAGGRQYLSRIRAGTRRMGDLIDGLLKLSRTSGGGLEVSEWDLSGLCGQVAGGLADLEPERRVAIAIRQGMRVRADPRLMLEVLENLLGNAWKFTSRQAAPRIEVGETVGASGEPVFFIRDNGAGFDMAGAGQLFTPFQRLHASSDFEGTGIGLAIVQRIIHRHGGRIWAEAEPGEGATFFFTFPGLA